MGQGLKTGTKMRHGLKIFLASFVILPVLIVALARACEPKSPLSPKDEAIAQNKKVSSDGHSNVLAEQTVPSPTPSEQLVAKASDFEGRPPVIVLRRNSSDLGVGLRESQVGEKVAASTAPPSQPVATPASTPRLNDGTAATMETPVDSTRPGQVAQVTSAPTTERLEKLTASSAPQPAPVFSPVATKVPLTFENDILDLPRSLLRGDTNGAETAANEAAAMPRAMSEVARAAPARSATQERSQGFALLDRPSAPTSGAAASASSAPSGQTPGAAVYNAPLLDLLFEASVWDVLGIEKFNRANDLRTTEPDLEGAKQDWRRAVELSSRVVVRLKEIPPPANFVEAKKFDSEKLLALAVHAQSLGLLARKVDHSQRDAARTAFAEYIEAELNPARRLQARNAMAQMLLETGVLAEALAVYDLVLHDAPDDPDALAGIAFVLVELGKVKETDGKSDEARELYRRATVSLRKFLEKAPEANFMRNRAQQLYDGMTARRP